MLVLVIILILILVLVFVLVLILFDKHISTSEYLCGYSAVLVYPPSYDLSFALKIRLAISPAKIAIVIPPADAFNPPVKMPINPN